MDEMSFKKYQFESKESVIDLLSRVRYCLGNGYHEYELILEWHCLLKFILKSYLLKIDTVFSSFPYSIEKHDHPDFLFVNDGETKTIEITRVTTRRKEALMSELNKDDTTELYEEITPDIFTDVVPHKFEMKKNLVRADEELMGGPIYGDFAEKQWAKICLKAILKKDRKDYNLPLDILLLDDEYWPLSLYNNVSKRIKILSELIEICPCHYYGVKIPTIIMESIHAISFIRNKYKWEFNAFEFSSKNIMTMNNMIRYNEPI